MFEWMWDDRLWFPANLNVTWKDLENKPGSDGYYPQLWDLNWSLVIGVVFLAVRYLTERTFIKPLGFHLGVKKRKKHVLTLNPLLESAYRQKKTLTHQNLEIITKSTDLTERQVQIWLKKRKQNDATEPIQKFAECGNSALYSALDVLDGNSRSDSPDRMFPSRTSRAEYIALYRTANWWLCLYYVLAFIGGLYVLWDKPWFADTKYNWIGWPFNPMPDSVYWYYMLECAFYWSIVFSLCYDNHRKDFKEMIFHHIATLFLIYFSWMMNFVRAGTLVLLVHDAADPLLAVAKMCRYTKLSENYSTGFFACFLVVWVISRLIIYPFKILYSTTIQPYIIIENTFFAHWFFNIFLYFLMFLHLMWSYSIARILVRKLTAGEMEDVRSDSEASEIEDDEEPYKNGKANTNHFNNNVKA